MESYVKIFSVTDGYRDAENEINEYLRRKNGTTKIVSISDLGQHHIIVVFEKGGE